MRRSAIALLLLLPTLSACNSKTDQRLKAIEDRLAKAETSLGEHKAITLRPGDTGYGLIDTDVGRIPVAIAEVQPQAGGSRVVLDFGNPSTARLTGMTAKIEWGGNDSKGLPLPANGAHMINFAAPQPLLPGSWRQYPVDLAGFAPARLGWVRISAFDSGTVDLLSQ
ncbi:DUF3251 domain-containing protein [Sphingomonas sp. SRS2]|uniref:DUF3251 domain-containing protein n=1 Tax=Sphingomonas sp. SRS2 TaxID=133190 RepID=UPI00061841DA|nr:DUF3251 domain-containing protein [Sphingomonas sp. SRS2]KKC26977.1 hypothetical protein WP12_05795 [Sphingomonas sp. SRS2]